MASDICNYIENKLETYVLGPYELNNLRMFIAKNVRIALRIIDEVLHLGGSSDLDCSYILLYSEYLSPYGTLQLKIWMDVVVDKCKGSADVMPHAEVCIELYRYKDILKRYPSHGAEVREELREFIESMHIFLDLIGKLKLESPFSTIDGRDVLESAIEGGEIGNDACGCYWPHGETIEEMIDDVVEFVKRVRESIIHVGPPHERPIDRRQHTIIEFLVDEFAKDLRNSVPIENAGYRSLTYIYERLGLARSTAYRLLEDLVKRRYLEHRSKGGYRIRPKAGITYALLAEKGYSDALLRLITWLWSRQGE